MNADTQPGRSDHRFLIGLLTGTFVGAGLALWLAPKAASEIQRRLTDSASALGRRASDRYQQASTCVDDTVDNLTKRGRRVRDDVANAVVRGAKEVERMAKAAKT